MGAERTARHQLRDEDLLVDLPTDGVVPAPFRPLGVVGRRRGQADEGHVPIQVPEKGFQGPVPFVPQVMGFVQADGADVPGPQPGDQVRVALLRCGVQGLIGRGVHGFQIMQVLGEQGVEALRVVQEQIPEPLAPLAADGGGGGEDEAGRVKPPDQLQTEDGLAAAGGGDDVEPSVVQIFLRVLQHAALAVAEGPAKTHPVVAAHVCLPFRFFQCTIDLSKGKGPFFAQSG